MASLPPSRCCTIGALHEGKPMGEVKNIANSKTSNKSNEDMTIMP